MRNTSEMREYIYSLKTSCGRCGIENPDILVFHHTNPLLKECDIGPHLTKEKIDEEVKKCEILCFNCHMLLHRTLRVTKRRNRNFSASNAASLARIGAYIARGQFLKESLQALPKDTLEEIRKEINKIIPPKRKGPRGPSPLKGINPAKRKKNN